MGIQGAAALTIACRQRHAPEIVFAAGILGTAAAAFHFDELDYSALILAAWLFLRTSPPVWQRFWLVVGVGAMEVMAFGPQAVQPIWDVATHAPPLVWNAGWLVILVARSFGEREVLAPKRVEIPVTL